jgi:hypothetical protein
VVAGAVDGAVEDPPPGPHAAKMKAAEAPSASSRRESVNCVLLHVLRPSTETPVVRGRIR